MINQDELATAFLAKLAASELNMVDQFTTQQSSLGPANRLNPMSFIPSVQQSQQVQSEVNIQEQQAIIDRLNKEAANAFPLPPPATSPIHEVYSEQDEGNKSTVNTVNLDQISTNLVDINNTLKELIEIIKTKL